MCRNFESKDFYSSFRKLHHKLFVRCQPFFTILSSFSIGHIRGGAIYWKARGGMKLEAWERRKTRPSAKQRLWNRHMVCRTRVGKVPKTRNNAELKQTFTYKTTLASKLYSTVTMGCVFTAIMTLTKLYLNILRMRHYQIVTYVHLFMIIRFYFQHTVT
jgi:hypothetical protein